MYIRAINDEIIDTYQLKSLDALVGTVIDRGTSILDKTSIKIISLLYRENNL